MFPEFNQPESVPPEVAQQLQQLFARQMVVAFLHHCAAIEAPASLGRDRLEELNQAGEKEAARALAAEFEPLLPNQEVVTQP
ncbi:MAG: hypothetical protein ACK486_05050 [Cyanobacteriota bacterium]